MNTDGHGFDLPLLFAARLDSAHDLIRNNSVAEEGHCLGATGYDRLNGVECLGVVAVGIVRG